MGHVPGAAGEPPADDTGEVGYLSSPLGGRIGAGTDWLAWLYMLVKGYRRRELPEVVGELVSWPGGRVVFLIMADHSGVLDSGREITQSRRIANIGAARSNNEGGREDSQVVS